MSAWELPASGQETEKTKEYSSVKYQERYAFSWNCLFDLIRAVKTSNARQKTYYKNPATS